MMIWKQHIFESGNSVVAPLTKQRSITFSAQRPAVAFNT